MQLSKHIAKHSLFLTLFCALFAAPIISKPLKKSTIVVEDKNPLKILTPSMKDVKTKKLILSNGIQVYIISDPLAKESSAAVSVNVGTWHDPDSRPGMAHFCEHMVFMGSKKYPDENTFAQFVNDNNGMRNAYTSRDQTVFMYTINNNNFDKSFDIFSRFFIDPIFSESSIEREMQAVNQEFMAQLDNDGWRAWYVFRETGNQNHPNARFGTGNYDTLKSIKRDELINWHAKHYTSEGMNLVAYSNQDIDKLTTLVENCFNEVPYSSREGLEVPYAKMSSSDQEGHICYMETIKDMKEISILWEIPPAYAKNYHTKSYELISYALTHKGEGSLYNYLSEQGLINTISYAAERHTNDHLLLEFNISLTEKGIREKDKVLFAFFQALNKLKTSNIPSHIFNDIVAVQKNEYCWQSRQDAFNLTMNTAAAMDKEPLETFPYGMSVISQYDKKESRNLLNYMHANNAMIFVYGKEHHTNKTADREHKIVHAKYSVEKTPDETLQAWNNAPANKDICLPTPNPYISKNQDVIAKKKSKKLLAPVIIGKDEGSCCYYVKDNYYLIPRGHIQVGIKARAINETNKSICLTKLYARYLQNHMKSLISEGGFAGIHTSIRPDNFALHISVDSYNDKISSYMMAFLSKLKSTQISREEFDLAKEQMISEANSHAHDQPALQGFRTIKTIISNNEIDYKQEQSSLQSISLEDLQFFHHSVLDENYLQIMIGGNLDKENGLLYYGEIKGALASRPFEEKSHIDASYQNIFTDTSKPRKISSKTHIRMNATVLFIDNGEFRYEKCGSNILFGSAVSEAFFDELRSKQQTGYFTRGLTRRDLNRMYSIFLVQSTTHYPEELLGRFELFLENYSKNLQETIPEERFASMKQSLIEDLQSKPENLSMHLARQYGLAFTHNGEFDRLDRIKKSLENLTYEQFISDSKGFITRENNKRLAILIKGAELDDKSFSYIEVTQQELASMTK